jgi:hypothetical protein
MQKASYLEYYGDLGRNTLPGPSTHVFDLALLKDFPIRESGSNLQFRWEVFNLFNHALFAQPTAICSAPVLLGPACREP